MRRGENEEILDRDSLCENGAGADGVNVNDGSIDWDINYRAVLEKAPELRIRYQVPGIVG